MGVAQWWVALWWGWALCTGAPSCTGAPVCTVRCTVLHCAPRCTVLHSGGGLHSGRVGHSGGGCTVVGKGVGVWCTVVGGVTQWLGTTTVSTEDPNTHSADWD